MTKDLNLLPLEILYGRQAKKRTRLMILYTILFIVVCLVGAESLIIEKMSYEKKKVSYQTQVNNLKDAGSLDNTLAEQKQRLNRYQEVLNTTGNLSEVYSGVLDKLEANTPQGVFILEMNFSGESLTAKCMAASNSDVSDFIRRLKDTGAFNDVFVSEMSSSNDSKGKGNGEVSFSLSCTINSQKGSTK